MPEMRMNSLKSLAMNWGSNGKIEGWYKSLKGECIRPGTPLSLEDARRLVKGYVEDYNNVRLNSAIGYTTPKDMLAGHQQEIQNERDRKLEAGTAEELPPAGRVTDETDYFPDCRLSSTRNGSTYMIEKSLALQQYSL